MSTAALTQKSGSGIAAVLNSGAEERPDKGGISRAPLILGGTGWATIGGHRRCNPLLGRVCAPVSTHRQAVNAKRRLCAFPGNIQVWDQLREFLEYTPDALECHPSDKNDGFRLHDLRLVQRYVEGRSFFLLHFKIAGLDGESVAYLHREKCLLLPSMGNLYKAPGRNSARQQCAMLVNNVQLMKAPDHISVTGSFVWLDTADNVYRLLPDALYFSDTLGLELGGGIVDWKRRIAIGNGAVRRNGGIRHVVEGASQVMQNIPEDQRKFRGNLVGDHDFPADLPAGMGIVSGRENVRFRLPEFVQNIVQLTEMLFGPVDF